MGERHQRLGRHGPLLVALSVIVLLLPFVNKPFHLDDVLFLRIAEQIRLQPLAPYDFDYHWSYWSIPMWRAMQNPPLNSYILSAVGLLAGRSEIGFHLAYLGLAIGCGLTMHALARRMCAHPLLATLLTVVSPAFLVSATNVMADIPLLFFWLLAIYCTVREIETSRPGWLWAAGLAALGAALTKYFGVALVPLLAAYWIHSRRRASIHLCALLLPLVALVAWGAHSQLHGGLFHPLTAAGYSTGQIKNRLVHAGSAGVFLGGVVIWPLFLLPLLRRLKARSLSLGVLVTAGLGWAGWGHLQPAGREWWLVWLITGVALTLMALAGLRSKDDGNALLLGLWFLGTMIFAAFFNWTVAARVILPAVFPAAVLVTRWAESLSDPPSRLRWLRAAAGAAVVVSVALATVDYGFASAQRTFARSVVRPLMSEQIAGFFVGHWGFQYYMEREGLEPYDYRYQFLDPGDLLVYPTHNSNIVTFNGPLVSIEQRNIPNGLGIHLMASGCNAGFYSSALGALPFNWCPRVPLDEFTVYRATARTRPPGPEVFRRRRTP